MARPTPSPWRVIIDDTGGPYSGWPSIEAPTELDMAIVHRAGFHHEFWDAHPGLPEALANAHLMAAAGDLADALEDLVNTLAPSGYTRTWEKAKDALRKAGRTVKGESDG